MVVQANGLARTRASPQLGQLMRITFAIQNGLDGDSVNVAQYVGQWIFIWVSVFCIRFLTL